MRDCPGQRPIPGALQRVITISGYFGRFRGSGGDFRIEDGACFERKGRLSPAHVGQALNAHVASPRCQEHDVARGDASEPRKEITLLYNHDLPAQRINAATFKLASVLEGRGDVGQDRLQLADLNDRHSGLLDQANNLRAGFERRSEPLLHGGADRKMQLLSNAPIEAPVDGSLVMDTGN